MKPDSTETSLAGLFDRVSHPWLESLGEPDMLRRMEQLCLNFSLDSSPCLVLECTIDDDTTALDLSFELYAQGFRQLKPMHHQTANVAECWNRIRHYCDEYARKDSVLGRHIAHTWLEYDTGSQAKMDVPSLFVELDNSGAQRHRFSEDIDGTFEALCRSATILNPSLSAATLDLFRQCGCELPEHAGVLGIGVMLARPDQALRFCANHVDLDELETYLRKLGWSGSMLPVIETLPQIPGYELGCRLAFDVSETIGDHIGVEIVAQPVDRFREHKDWGLWLEALVQSKLCTQFKHDILIDWLGQSTHRVAGRYTPDRVFRDISHLKFTFDTLGKVRTKAYLHAAHLSGGSLQGWFLQQFENLETGAPPPALSDMQ